MSQGGTCRTSSASRTRTELAPPGGLTARSIASFQGAGVRDGHSVGCLAVRVHLTQRESRWLFDPNVDNNRRGEWFAASAFGDLDCDGEYSTFVRFGRIENSEVEVSSGMYISNERE